MSICTHFRGCFLNLFCSLSSFIFRKYYILKHIEPLVNCMHNFTSRFLYFVFYHFYWMLTKELWCIENRDQSKPRKLEYFPYKAIRSHVIKARCLYIFLLWGQNWSFVRSVLEREWLNQCDWKAKQKVCMWEEEKIEFFSRFFSEAMLCCFSKENHF